MKVPYFHNQSAGSQTGRVQLEANQILIKREGI